MVGPLPAGVALVIQVIPRIKLILMELQSSALVAQHKGQTTVAQELQVAHSGL